MKFDSNIRYKLVKYALSSIDINMDFSKGHDFDDILAIEILNKSFYCIRYQIEEYDELNNNELNKLISATIQNINTDDKYYNDLKSELLGNLQYYKITNDYNIDKVVLARPEDEQLLEYCILYLEFIKTKRDKKSKKRNKNVASDSFIFEKLIKRIAEDLYGVKNVTQVLKQIDDIGQSLIADTIIKLNNNKYILIDAKFYESGLSKKGHGKETYKHQNNRFQMNAYIEQLKYNNNINSDNIQGLIIHAVTCEMYDKYNGINHKSMNIGHNKINLELIKIDTTTEEIINQVKELITHYAKIINN